MKLSKTALATLFLIAPLTVACSDDGSGDDGGVGGDDGGNGAAMTNPFDGDAAAADAGETLYNDTGCGSCHGSDGSGSGDFPALTTAAADWPDSKLYNVIANGVDGTVMAAYESDLGGEDGVWQVVTYVRTFAE